MVELLLQLRLLLRWPSQPPFLDLDPFCSQQSYRSTVASSAAHRSDAQAAVPPSLSIL